VLSGFSQTSESCSIRIFDFGSTTSKPSATSGGPMRIGHVRKRAAPTSPATVINQRLCSWSQRINVHNIPTANNSATTCARNEYWVNELRKYVCEAKSETEARAEIGTRD